MKRSATRHRASWDETRRLILAAARELYLETGYRDAPTRRLAERAGVAEGTVFAHFPDKPSILAAALDEDIGIVLARAKDGLPREGPCRVKLLHLAGAFYAFYAARPELSRALVKESLFLGGEWGERVTRTALEFVSYVAGIVNEAREAGEYDPGVDPAVAARSFFSAYFMELVAGLAAPRFDPKETLSRLSAQIMLWERGLAARTPRQDEAKEEAWDS